jgi:MEMO1 family protein
MSIRPPAVAGLFYPDDPQHLARAVADYLAAAEPDGAVSADFPEAVPKAVVVPHAGFVYSAPVAASAYALLRPLKGRLSRVLLLGPAHRVAIRGLAASRVDAFDTPLGRLPVDHEAVARIAALPQVTVNDEPHRLEHCLEVQLPFIIACLGSVPIVPLVVGDASAAEVAQVIEMLWDGPETLVVISSDLSHYHDYETARRMDAATSAAIEALDEGGIGWDDACGRIPISGLLRIARKRGLRVQTIDLRNSGDTAGPMSEVVGYGAYVFA